MAEPHVSDDLGRVVDDVTKQNRDGKYVGMPHYRFGDVYEDDNGSKLTLVKAIDFWDDAFELDEYYDYNKTIFEVAFGDLKKFGMLNGKKGLIDIEEDQLPQYILQK